jgi:hypothetical protein
MKSRFFLLVILVCVFAESKAQKPCLGAFYFDGWSGNDPNIMSKTLTQGFANRESKWGWLTSSQKTVDEQINYAADAGLSFFSFDWYYNSNFKNQPLNRALGFYRNSPYNNRLKYCLMVANHDPFIIGPKDWGAVVTEWVSQFKSPTYLKVDNKPLLIIFSIETMVKKFGSAQKVHDALDSLRQVATSQGLPGVTVAICMRTDLFNIRLAEQCGFDMLTGYNYPGAGMPKDLLSTVNQYQASLKDKSVQAAPPNKASLAVPIANLQSGEVKIWNQFPKLSKLKYIPAVTLNWDPRAWANPGNNYLNRPYYVGYSPASVKKSISNCIQWVNANPNATSKEKVILLYAWNEIGEGAWLTPTKNGVDLLKDVKPMVSGN